MPEVFELKVIKAKKLNVDAYRKEIKRALAQEGRDVKKEYEKTTKTWKTKVRFETIIDVTGDTAAVAVGTNNEIYGYVDNGTPDHRVPKSGIATMAFHEGYKPKTGPGKIHSRRGGPFGKRIVRTGAWKVRGIKARKFSETIGKQRKKPFTKRMVGAMKSASKKAF